MKTSFETDYPSILEKIKQIDPIQYGKTRNYTDGAVSYLSPYISRGVISTRQVLESVIERGFALQDIESFVKELCWRDYFQKIAQVKDVNHALKNEQTPVSNKQIPLAILNACTGIEGVDHAIRQLFQTGYMHNHCRMYTASLTCNFAHSHWKLPAQWMYYHLLDGDWASNACSWQWVAGANSAKKYVFNQENVNQYCHTKSQGTFIDLPYERLDCSSIPAVLQNCSAWALKTNLPESKELEIDPQLPICIYNYYNLDPVWQSNTNANRILLLEPHFFEQYPVSDACIQFCLNLSGNIPQLQVYCKSFEDLKQRYPNTEFIYKEHPFNRHYVGKETARDWMHKGQAQYFPSFFNYWKHVQKDIQKLFEQKQLTRKQTSTN